METTKAQDAINFLKSQHKEVKTLFKAFEKLCKKSECTPEEMQQKGDLRTQICDKLTMHAALEEQIFYPSVRECLEDDVDIVLESLEEHRVVKWMITELKSVRPEDERFEARMTVLQERVEHHVQEEEDELFPQVRDLLGRKQLREIGSAMQEAMPMLTDLQANPKAPDTPPRNLTPQTQPLYEQAMEVVRSR